MKATAEEALAAIKSEREYQKKLWIPPAHKHTALQFAVYIRDYVQEGLHILSRFDMSSMPSGTDPNVETNKAILQVTAIIRKVAAMALAYLEQENKSTSGLCSRFCSSLEELFVRLDRKAESVISNSVYEPWSLQQDILSRSMWELYNLALSGLVTFGAPLRDLNDLYHRVTIL